MLDSSSEYVSVPKRELFFGVRRDATIMAYGSIEGRFSFEEKESRDAWRRKLMVAVVFSSLLVMGTVFAHLATRIEEQEGTGVVMMQNGGLASQLSQKIVSDEQRLAHDVAEQQQYLRYQSLEGASAKARTMLTTYGDGCVCSCPSGGCDEEKHQGPVCHCPKEAQTSLPPPFAPFNMDSSVRSARGNAAPTQKMYGGPVLRKQQMWVGSPQKMLPPDGDYPGGATGIPEDGYIAYETGYMDDGPFHGELAPMQEAGIASKQQIPQQLREQVVRYIRPSYPPYVHGAAEPQQRRGARLPPTPRRQQMWVGSPQKMLPPDGDYPGGATGIPEDGYIAYETGYMDDGPFHGELAPMQEAGIASKQQIPQQLQMKYIRPSYPPYVHGAAEPQQRRGARLPPTPRRQQMWVGSPQKMLPPDGDYPGGATGIPEDGYIAYETGYMDDGPFHGELAPMQEAGIASKGRPSQLSVQARFHQLKVLSAQRRRAFHQQQQQQQRQPQQARRQPASAAARRQFVDGAGDENVPAAAIDRSYFVGEPTQGASIRALENLV